MRGKLRIGMGFTLLTLTGGCDNVIEKLGLSNITLVVHDWGSGLGFHYAARHEDNPALMGKELARWYSVL